jgi:hypothetical protein
MMNAFKRKYASYILYRTALHILSQIIRQTGLSSERAEVTAVKFKYSYQSKQTFQSNKQVQNDNQEQ